MGCSTSSLNTFHKDKYGPRYFIKPKKTKGRKMIEKVELYFSCINATQDLSNLKIVLGLSTQYSNFQPIGETEELQPGSTNFLTFIALDYYFELHQNLQISLIQNNVCLETITSSLGYIVGSRQNTSDFNISRNGFTLRVNARKASSNDELRIDFSANVTNKHGLNGLYYMRVLYFDRMKNKWKKAFKTGEGSGAFFKLEFDQVNYKQIADSNEYNEFKVEICKFNSGVVGGFKTSISLLNNRAVYDIGNFSVEMKYAMKPRIKFFDFLQKSLQISFMVAIDYTGSNGEYNNPSSLHFIRGYGPNQYEQAIRQSGSIICNYDYDKKFPVYGFGGEYHGLSDVSHFFNVNLSSDPEVYGLEGIIDCYKKSLSNITLSGPTYFAPLINGVVEKIKSQMKNNSNITNVYNVLLLLTDGLILDMEETKKAIFKAAKYPLSIIIVGVGNSSDLNKMEKLDGDPENPLVIEKGHKKKKVSRDIVQFVQFNKYLGNPDKFAQELLSEIPFQVEEYFETYHTFGHPKIQNYVRVNY